MPRTTQTSTPDDNIRSRLYDLDNASDDVDVTAWEADFIESVVFGGSDYVAEWPLTKRQREVAEDILAKYGF